jgi:hypothetical protein
MNNQLTERWEQAAQARLAHGAGRPRRRWLTRRRRQLARRPGVTTQPAAHHPQSVR